MFFGELQNLIEALKRSQKMAGKDDKWAWMINLIVNFSNRAYFLQCQQ